MELTVIGSGSIWSCRNSACCLLDGMLIDLPNGCCKALRRLGVRPGQIRSVFLTHLHGDHCFDLPFWVLECLKFGDPEEPLQIYTAEECVPYLERLIREAFPATISEEKLKRFLRWETAPEAEIGGMRMTRVLADHGNIAPAFGYRFEKEGKAVGFTGDSCLCPGVEELAASCGLLIADAMLPSGNDKHMGVDDLRRLALRYPDCSFYGTHLNDDSRELLETCGLPNLRPAEDGMKIRI